MTTRSQQTETRRWLLPFLAALVGVLAVIGLAGTASANERGASQNRVGAFNVAGEVLVEPPQHIAAGQSRDAAQESAEIVVATGVAANSERLLARADRIEQHLTRLDHSPANDAMLSRIRSAATSGSPLSRADRAFMRHESTEAWLMDRGVGYSPAHRVAGWTHRTFGNYDPSVIKQFPEYFGTGRKRYWGIE